MVFIRTARKYWKKDECAISQLQIKICFCHQGRGDRRQRPVNNYCVMNSRFFFIVQKRFFSSANLGRKVSPALRSLHFSRFLNATVVREILNGMDGSAVDTVFNCNAIFMDRAMEKPVLTTIHSSYLNVDDCLLQHNSKFEKKNNCGVNKRGRILQEILFSLFCLEICQVLIFSRCTLTYSISLQNMFSNLRASFSKCFRMWATQIQQ